MVRSGRTAGGSIAKAIEDSDSSAGGSIAKVVEDSDSD
jgi:hypothetical protein